MTPPHPRPRQSFTGSSWVSAQIMRSPLTLPYRVVSSDRKSCHWRRLSVMAPDTALVKLSPTMPRGVVGSVARPVLIDLANGSSRQIDWSVGSVASWQRRAS